MKFMENVNKHQVNVPYGEGVEEIPIYEKIVKNLVTGECKPKYDENIALT